MTPILLQKEENVEKFVASIWVKKVELEAQSKNDCIRTKEKLKSLTKKVRVWSFSTVRHWWHSKT